MDTHMNVIRNGAEHVDDDPGKLLEARDAFRDVFTHDVGHKREHFHLLMHQVS